MSLTAAERCALKYMDPQMWSTAAEIGRHIYNSGNARGSNIQSIGAVVIGRLRRRGLVSDVCGDGLWRITKAGRATLNEE